MGNKYFSSKNIIILLATIVFAVSWLEAQKLTNISYPSPTSLVLSFDTPEAVDPSMFLSSLSDDKTSIKLDLQFVDFTDELKNQSKSGKINGLFFNNNNSHLEVDIKLNDSYGYTCVPQPLSSSIALSIFKWNELDAGEDAYRAAQLALESNIESEAISSLVEAIDYGNRPAKALLAYINSNTNPKESAKQFAQCVPSDTELPDVAFVASDMLSRNGYEAEASEWLERYSYLTGESIGTESAPNTHLDELMASKDKPEEAEVEPIVTASAGEDNLGRNWEDLFLLIGISFTSIAFITIALVIVQKRRARRIKEEVTISEETEKEIQDETFEDQLASAKKKRLDSINNTRNSTVLIAEIAERTKKNRVISNLKSDSMNSKIDRTIDDLPSIKKKLVAEAIVDEETGSANVHVEEKKSDIEDFLRTFIPQQKNEKQYNNNDMASTIKSVIREVETANLDSANNSQSAELELALKIAQKESNNKYSKLRKLDLGKLEGNSKIDELSKQLNIDSSTLSAKRNVSELQGNKGRISKLSKRFDVK